MSKVAVFPEKHQFTDNDVFVVFYRDRIFTQDEKIFFIGNEIDSFKLVQSRQIFIDSVDGKHYFLFLASEDPSRFVEGRLRSLRGILFSDNPLMFAIAGKAAQLVDWYQNHEFCGACGNKTINHEDQRAVCCSACRKQFFPRINPCAIMLVVDGDKILLARSARFKSDFFSCLAGFMEVGETAEETVAREVKEEVGLEVENIRYLKSQSWPFPSQLMLGFFADYKSGEIVPEPEEIAEANWYHVNDLPTVPSAGISVAGELIEHYVNQVNGKLS